MYFNLVMIIFKYFNNTFTGKMLTSTWNRDFGEIFYGKLFSLKIPR